MCLLPAVRRTVHEFVSSLSCCKALEMESPKLEALLLGTLVALTNLRVLLGVRGRPLPLPTTPTAVEVEGRLSGKA